MSEALSQSGADLSLAAYRPLSQLVVKESAVSHPRYEVIDAHNHLGATFGGAWLERPVGTLLDVLDEAGVACIVDLDGGWGEVILERHLDHFKAAAPERFLHFGGVEWSRWSEHGNHFGEWAADRLRQQVARGAQGLKIWKNLGLHVTDENGRLVAVDDERLDPIWATAAELNIPILIHVADPVAFFDPMDERNERWEELKANPDWHFPSPPFPSFISIFDSLTALVKRHPTTTFIGAHVGCYPENLSQVGRLLDEAPNFFVDIGARVAELGRQPYSARRFFLKYADRILFSTDLAADTGMYRLHYRFLETDDEYFPYSPDEIPPQGRWQIYGLYLPDDVLEKVYNSNARRVLNMS